MTQREPTLLFDTIQFELTRYVNELESQAKLDVLTFPLSQGDRLGHMLFSNLSKGGYCTLPVTGRRSWNPQSHYYQTARFAAKRRCEIIRAFLLPHKQCRHDPTLLEHLQLDQEAGIETRILYVGDLIDTLSLPLAESLEFGVWDDVVCCVGIPGPHGAAGGISEWRVSRRAEDLQILSDIINILNTKATIVTLSEDEEDAPDLEEPMITTAPMTFEIAKVLCQGDHVSPQDCSWYHSIWQYLRIFDMVSTPTWHTKFYLDSFRELWKDGNYRRILITGAADYSILAHVLWAYRDSKPPPEVSILDLCETPLFLCKWYGKLVGVKVSSIVTDLLEHEASLSFDLITTDAFLTRFPISVRPSVVSKWFDLLRPDGKVVTTVRIEPGLPGVPIRASQDQADSFRRRAHQEAMMWQGFIGHTPEEIANHAQRYAERMISYSFGSDSELCDLLVSGGFNIDRIDIIEVPGEMASTIYAEVIASRC